MILCPQCSDLPPPPPGKSGWPWTEESLRSETPPESVSIIMPVYQSADTLEESIRSVLLQGLPALELIIMDGGSQDGTVELLEKYSPWIHYWESLPDRGQTHAIAKGLSRASGTYINWHNADDVLLPDSLATTLNGFHIHPDAVYICRHRLLLHPDGHIEEKSTRPPPGLIDLRRALLATSPGGQPGGLLRHDIAKEAGGIDESFCCCMDEDLMIRMRLLGPGYYLDTPGILFRVHPDQKSALLTRERIREKFRLIRIIYRRLPPNDPHQALKASSRIFAAGHAIGLCLQAGKSWQAKYWHIRYRFAQAWERLRRRPVHTP